MKKSSRKVGHTQQKTIPDLYRETANIHPEAENPTPWPVRVEERLSQLVARVAKLEAESSELKATVLSAAVEMLKGRR